MALSSAVVTEKAQPLILSYVILVIKYTQSKVFAPLKVMVVLLLTSGKSGLYKLFIIREKGEGLDSGNSRILLAFIVLNASMS